jgi:hypothetical protein
MDPFRLDTNTMGTPFPNARATARYAGEIFAVGQAVCIDSVNHGGLLCMRVGQGDTWQSDIIELGHRVVNAVDPWVLAG